MKMVKRVLVTVAVLAIVGFAGLNVLAYNQARAMTRFASAGLRTETPEDLSFWAKIKVMIGGVNTPRPSSRLLPTDLASNCEVLSIGVSEYVTLEAWYCNRGETAPLVMLFHGYAAEKTAMLKEAQAFLDLGASVLLVDFRGSGGSSEAYTTVGVDEAEDVAAVFGFAERSIPHGRGVLFGQSMGAVAILRAVDKYGIQPDAVIVEAVFDTMLHTVCNRFHTMHVPSFPSAELLLFWGGQQCGFNGFRHNPVDYAASVNCPALFMHGAEDSRAQLAEGRRAYDAVPGPKKFEIFAHAGHGSYVSSNPDQWRAAVNPFL